MRFILIEEGFKSDQYLRSVEADTPEEALVKCVNEGECLQGTMLLAVVVEGMPDMMRRWTAAGRDGIRYEGGSMRKRYALIRLACLMEDEGADTFVASYSTREEAEMALARKVGESGGYFSRGDYVIFESTDES